MAPFPPSDRATESVLKALRDAAEIDLGDHLRFRIEVTTRGAPQGAADGGERLTVVPELGGQRFMPFPLDVGFGDADREPADVLRGGIDLTFAGLAPLQVPAVPIAVHVAEKLHALSYPRSDGRQNSRVKDLVDVVHLQHAVLADIEGVRRAVAATFDRRGTHELPVRIGVPMRTWAAEYRKMASGRPGKSRQIADVLRERALKHASWVADVYADELRAIPARQAPVVGKLARAHMMRIAGQVPQSLSEARSETEKLFA